MGNVASTSLDTLAAAVSTAEDVQQCSVEDSEEKEEAPPSMLETLKFGLTTDRLYMYIPIMLYNGMSLGFFLSDFTRYITDEAVGISHDLPAIDAPSPASALLSPC